MNFLDRTLLRLANGAERSAVFTTTAGRRILEATYHFDTRPLDQVTGVHVQQVQLGVSVAEEQPFQASVLPSGGMDRWDLQGGLTRVLMDGFVHAQVVGLITATTRPVRTTVEAVEVEALTDVGDLAAVDARIVAEDGSLPGDPAALDARRLVALKDRFRERFERPEDLDVDHFLGTRGIRTTREFVDYLTRRIPARVGLDLAIIPEPGFRSDDYPFGVSVLIAEGFLTSLTETVARIQYLRGLLARMGTPRAVPKGLKARAEFPFLVLFPQGGLADAGLPLAAGVDPASPEPALQNGRLTELGTRLRPLGIALSTI